MSLSGCQLQNSEIEEVAKHFAKQLTIYELTRTSDDSPIPTASVVTTYLEKLDGLLDALSEQNAERKSVY